MRKLFLEGEVNDELLPLAKDVFLVGKHGNIALRCIIDTGFNGMFSIPQRYKRKAQLSFLGFERFELADGSPVKEEVYAARILIGGTPYWVETTLTDLEVGLIGMELLVGRIATFDLKKMIITVRT